MCLRHRFLARATRVAVVSLTLALAGGVRAESTVTRFETIEPALGTGRVFVRTAIGSARLTDAGGKSRRLPIRRDEHLRDVADLEDGVFLAGVRLDAGTSDLVLLRADARDVIRLPAPPGSGWLRLRPILLGDRAAGGSLGSLAWLEGDRPDQLTVWTSTWTGNDWDPPVAVSRPGRGSQSGLAATTLADGSRLMVWSRFDGDDDELFWSVGWGDHFSEPRRVGSDNLVPDITPTLIPHPRGRGAWLAWSRFDGTQYTLAAATFDGRSWRSLPWKSAGAALSPLFERRDKKTRLLYRDPQTTETVARSIDRRGRISPIGLPPAPTALVPTSRGSGSAVQVFLAFGDSITRGVGDPSGRGYAPRLEKMLNRKIDAEVQNFGRNAEDTTEALSRIDSVLDMGGDVLLLMEGTNDVTQIFDGRLSRETTVANLDSMAKRARARGLEAIHATILPRPIWASRDTENYTTRFLSFAIRELAIKRKRRLVDVFEAFDPDIVSGRSRLYAPPPDFVGHPNVDGYKRIASVFADVLLDVDAVPPVMGPFAPGFPELLPGGEIKPRTEFRVTLLEPKAASGIDVENTKLLINGKPVGELDGGERRVTIVHKGGKALGCRARVSLVATDLNADGPNTITRDLGIYAIRGRRVFKGDADFDCRVDGVDLALFGPRFGARRGQERFDPFLDFNEDGRINGEDLALLAMNFGKSSL